MNVGVIIVGVLAWLALRGQPAAPAAPEADNDTVGADTVPIGVVTGGPLTVNGEAQRVVLSPRSLPTGVTALHPAVAAVVTRGPVSQPAQLAQIRRLKRG